MIVAFLAAVAAALPGYALGQPLQEARAVVPAGKSAATWHLRCAGDAGAPPGLTLSPAERSAGVMRCWTMEIVNGIERRAGNPFPNKRRSTEEIEFLDGRIVRITRVYYSSPADAVGRREVWEVPEAKRIDRLAG